jgi:hypothetical protein
VAAGLLGQSVVYRGRIAIGWREELATAAAKSVHGGSFRAFWRKHGAVPGVTIFTFDRLGPSPYHFRDETIAMFYQNRAGC